MQEQGMSSGKRVSVVGAEEHVGITSGGTGPPRPRPNGGSNRPTVPPTVAQCYQAALQARNPGYLYTRTVSGRLGTVVAAVGIRLGVHPTYLTLANLVLGIGGSAAVMAGHSPDRTAPLVVAGVVLWQAAYIFDCADGKLARASGKTSAYGKSVDIFADLAVQISVVVALSSIILSSNKIHDLLTVLFASLWYLNFVTVLLARGDDQVSHSLIARRTTFVSAAKLLRDYGLIILVLGTWLCVSPSTLIVPVMAVTATNLLLLVGYVARSTGLSIRAARKYSEVL
jgi:phosphatidylglycerophosphate synthase